MTREKLKDLQKLQQHIDEVKKFVEEYDSFKEGTEAGVEPVRLRLTVHRGGHDYASVTLSSVFNICRSIMDPMHEYLEELETKFENS